MKKYINLIENRNATHLKIEVYYNLGGFNVFTYQEEKRGYYISVSPVCKNRRDGVTFEEYTAFSGVKQLVKAVSRKSAKAENEAEAIAASIEKDLIAYVCNKNGLEVA